MNMENVALHNALCVVSDTLKALTDYFKVSNKDIRIEYPTTDFPGLFSFSSFNCRLNNMSYEDILNFASVHKLHCGIVFVTSTHVEFTFSPIVHPPLQLSEQPKNNT